MTTLNDDVIDCMTRMKGEEQPFAVATVVRVGGAAAAKPGAKAVIRGDGEIIGWIGGSCATGAVRKAGLRSLIDGQAHLIRVSPAGPDAEDGVATYRSSCPSGGTIELFIEPVLPRPAILVLGASPVARTLCDIAARTGFAVTIAAARDDLAAFHTAHQRIEGFNLDSLERADIRHIVVATQGRRDKAALRAALDSSAGYVGFIGSRKKAAALRDELENDGVARQRLDVMRSPAGLNIGAVTPEEIALSVLAEIVQDRRMGIGPARDVNPGTVDSAPEQSPDRQVASDCCGH